jgi:hypothetical protein
VDVITWLLEGDPAIRWQVLADLLGAPTSEVEAERTRVEHEGWGARLLAHQGADGLWAGGAYVPADHVWGGDEPGQPWTATMHTLQTLRRLGLPGDSAAARRTAQLVAANGRWEHDGQLYFDGEVEPCINGRTVEAGAWLGVDVRGVVDRLLDERLSDGGWNCEAERGATVSSFDTTINVVEGLLAYEHAVGGDAEVRAAREGGEEYLLERGLFRRRSNGEVADPLFLELAFPSYWHLDVLRGLEHARAAGRRDPRLAEAIEVLRSRQQDDGRWLLERVHPGRVWFDLEDEGEPSRWITLGALRVLRWWGDDG